MHELSVEVLMLHADHTGTWSYRHLTVPPGPGESPDEAARRACELAPGAPDSVVHSTSWRYDRERARVVLTYAVCPDPVPGAPRAVLGDLPIARGPAPASPSPERIEMANVAAHAIQHLAFLMATDPVVGETLARRPAIAAALRSCSPVPAGELGTTQITFGRAAAAGR
ncbi:hypothetical protein [Nonomuraea typhae]|uniref:hypothetical protein n=1 Tax=Nonomuraea typhae TaxID=2603600 RepID=UPI0012F87878|nr:hypothetical protein [Nonomuraea typhae]